jgi:hypothetical protein
LTAEEVVEAYDLVSLAQNEYLDTLYLGLPSAIYVRDDPLRETGRLPDIRDLRPFYDEMGNIIRREWERQGRKLTFVIQSRF